MMLINLLYCCDKMSNHMNGWITWTNLAKSHYQNNTIFTVS